MLKKILIGFGVVLVLFAAFAAYVVTRPRVSPRATATFAGDGLEVKVAYSSPLKKGRLIFGDASAKALVPFGKYWRLGANEATEITFNKNVSFAGKPVSAGSYRMYAVPGATTWKVVLNSALGKWGAWEADHGKDIVTVELPVETTATPLESFLISFTKAPLTMDFAWDTTVVHVPLAGS
jgi:hypothetical protein